MNDASKRQIASLQSDLIQLQQYLEEFNNFLPLAVCSITLKGALLENNAAFEKLTGYSQIDSAGTPLEKFFINPDKFRNLLVEVQSGNLSASTDLTLLKKDLEKIEVKVTASMRADQSGYFIGISDITELKRFQERLEEMVFERTQRLEETLEQVEREKEKTSSIVRSLTDGLLLIDGTGRVLLMNPSAVQLLSLESDGTGKILSMFGERGKKIDTAITTMQQDSVDVELRPGLIVNLLKTPFISGGQNVWLIVLHDISEQKALDRMKAEFVSIAAHQMRTPLAAVNWSYELLREKLRDNQELQQIINHGMLTTTRLSEMVNSLLQVDQIESGTFDYESSLVDLVALAKSTIDEINEGQAKLYNNHVVLNSEYPSVVAKADGEKMKIVLQNLVENALSYTSNGQPVKVIIEKDEKEARVKVIDKGIGINPEDMDHLFNKFYRANNARSIRPDGSGLGLYIVKQLVTGNNGTIEVESTPGEGTTFIITLPYK